MAFDVRGNLNFSVVILFGNEVPLSFLSSRLDDYEIALPIDITHLVEQITINQSIEQGQCGRAELALVKDNNEYIDKLLFTNGYRGGSNIVIRVGTVVVFYGYVFNMGTRGDTYNVIAYDQLRYWQNPCVRTIQKMNLIQAFDFLCNDMKLTEQQRRVVGSVPDDAIIRPRQFENTSYYDALHYCINATVTLTGKRWAVIDEGGTLTLRSIFDGLPRFFLGDKAYITAYEYQHSIDDQTYNEVYVITEDEDEAKAGAETNKENKTQYITYKGDTKTIQKWGNLALMVKIGTFTLEQAEEFAQNLLDLHNRPTERFIIDCIGNTTIRPGVWGIVGVYEINKLGRYIARNVTHNITHSEHNMTVEFDDYGFNSRDSLFAPTEQPAQTPG